LWEQGLMHCFLQRSVWGGYLDYILGLKYNLTHSEGHYR